MDSQSSAWCESLLLLLLFFPLTKLQNFLRVFVVLVSCPPCALLAWRGVRIHHHHHANGETREASRCWGWRPTGSPWVQPALPQVPAFPHILGPASSWRASPGHVQRGCLHGPPHPRQRSAAPSSALWSQHLQERPLSVLCQLGSRTRKDSPPHKSRISRSSHCEGRGRGSQQQTMEDALRTFPFLQMFSLSGFLSPCPQEVPALGDCPLIIHAKRSSPAQPARPDLQKGPHRP